MREVASQAWCLLDCLLSRCRSYEEWYVRRLDTEFMKMGLRGMTILGEPM